MAEADERGGGGVYSCLSGGFSYNGGGLYKGWAWAWIWGMSMGVYRYDEHTIAFNVSVAVAIIPHLGSSPFAASKTPPAKFWLILVPIDHFTLELHRPDTTAFSCLSCLVRRTPVVLSAARLS